MIEMELTNFTKPEVCEVVAAYVGISEDDLEKAIELLIKLKVISPYVFVEETKEKKK